jgi:HK97 gp10 family phage protein
MKTFDGFAAFADYLQFRGLETVRELQHGLERAAVMVEKTAKAEIGTYQPEVGPFQAWEPLAESTIEDRIRQGFTPDDPLLRSGELRASISHQVAPGEAVIGSTSKIAAYQELGTSTIPPRPFLGPAAMHNEKRIVEQLGATFVNGLAGGQRIHPTLGYDMKLDEEK